VRGLDPKLLRCRGAVCHRGVYVNFMPEDEAGRVQSGAYGANYARLATLKKTFDPENLFRLNQNITPGGGR